MPRGLPYLAIDGRHLLGAKAGLKNIFVVVLVTGTMYLFGLANPPAEHIRREKLSNLPESGIAE